MSSLRNSLHRRNHKERSQLAHRARLGILEKHKDYVLRARDYHSKQDRLTRLKQKAADRNKDEFYFSMYNQKTEAGVHVQERGNEPLPADIVKVLKSQDENYIRTTRLAGLKKIGRIKIQLSTIADLLKPNSPDTEDGLHDDKVQILRTAGIIAGPSGTNRSTTIRCKGKHIIFAESDEQVQDKARSPKESGQTISPSADPFDLGWKHDGGSNRMRKRQSSQADNVTDDTTELQQEAKGHRSKLLKELSARLHRDQQLRYAERELEMQKLLMSKGRSKKIAGVEKVSDGDNDDDDEGDSRSRRKVSDKTWKPRVYKWKLDRKR